MSFFVLASRMKIKLDAATINRGSVGASLFKAHAQQCTLRSTLTFLSACRAFLICHSTYMVHRHTSIIITMAGFEDASLGKIYSRPSLPAAIVALHWRTVDFHFSTHSGLSKRPRSHKVSRDLVVQGNVDVVYRGGACLSLDCRSIIQ